MKLDAVDKSIINRIQSDFPIESRPYLAIANELGLMEDQVIDRVTALRSEGVIRRIGGNFVPHKVGYVSTLCAARVPENRMDLFTQTVNRYPGVTHNYQRDNEFNVWFTFIAPSMAQIEKNLETISRETGITQIINLPATRVFKIKAQFDL